MHTEWSIDLESGHCRHNLGLDAYVDCNSNHYSHLPLLTPTSPNKPDSIIMADLILAIEDLCPGTVVIPGIRVAEKTESSCSIKVLGFQIEWTPLVSLRSLLLLETDQPLEFFLKEWMIESASKISHMSGITVDRYAVDESIPQEFSRIAAHIFDLMKTNNFTDQPKAIAV